MVGRSRRVCGRDSPGVGFLAGPELLEFYETAIVSPTFSVLVSLGLLERATFSILCSCFLWRALRTRATKYHHHGNETLTYREHQSHNANGCVPHKQQDSAGAVLLRWPHSKTCFCFCSEQTALCKQGHSPCSSFMLFTVLAAPPPWLPRHPSATASSTFRF